MRYVLIFGSRGIDPDRAQAEIQRFLKDGGHTHKTTVVIEGGAQGVDSIARYEAQQLGIHVATVDALWDFNKRAGGPIRNWVMADMIKRLGGEALGLWDGTPKSKGTPDMRDRLVKAGVLVECVTIWAG